MKKDTKTDWQERVNRVLVLLTGSLDSPPDLEKAAGEATSSPWHFNRSFKEITGESFSAVLRRLRLERAAYRLKDGESVINAALEAGFETPESFCRVFTRNFGLNPSRLAKLPWWEGELLTTNGLHYRGDRQKLWFFPTGTGGQTATRIVTLGVTRIASLSGEGDFWQLPSLWKEFALRLKASNRPILPGQALTVFDGGQRFRTALLLDNVELCPPETDESTLPGSSYAVTVFFGPTEGIGPFWDAQRESFYPASGWLRDPDRPSLEWYQNCPPPETPELALTFLCDPVIPRF